MTVHIFLLLSIKRVEFDLLGPDKYIFTLIKKETNIKVHLNICCHNIAFFNAESFNDF